jgi:hypothetical protein
MFIEAQNPRQRLAHCRSDRCRVAAGAGQGAWSNWQADRHRNCRCDPRCNRPHNHGNLYAIWQRHRSNPVPRWKWVEEYGDLEPIGLHTIPVTLVNVGDGDAFNVRIKSDSHNTYIAGGFKVDKFPVPRVSTADQLEQLVQLHYASGHVHDDDHTMDFYVPFTNMSLIWLAKPPQLKHHRRRRRSTTNPTSPSAADRAASWPPVHRPLLRRGDDVFAEVVP